MWLPSLNVGTTTESCGIAATSPSPRFYLTPQGVCAVHAMTERWYTEKKREGFYRRAKKEGYRARSAYKILQIQEKFSIIRKGDVVVDLGASPGGWSQVAVELA